jgi:hypothetical protein
LCVVVVALAAGLSGCRAAASEPASWAAQPTASPGTVTHVFGPDAAPTGDCGDELDSLVAAPDGTVYVGEQTCLLSAGYGEPGRHHRTSRRPPFVLHALHPDGSVTQLPLPPGPRDHRLRLLAVTRDGALIAYDFAHGQLTRYAAGGWTGMSAAQADDGSRSHDGDGGQVEAAHVVDALSGALGPDGSVYVAEPFAVRRITPTGVATTVAGTDRHDPPASAGYWGGRGSAGQDGPPKPVTSGPAHAATTPMPFIADMSVSSDGSIWLVSAGVVYRVTPADVFSRFAVLPSAAAPAPDPSSDVPRYDAAYNLVPTADGRALFAFDGVDSTVYRIDVAATTVRKVVRVPKASGSPGYSGVDLAVTANGDLLVCDRSYGLLRIAGVAR